MTAENEAGKAVKESVERNTPVRVRKGIKRAMCLYLRAGKKEKDGKTIKEECALWKQRADKKGRMATVSGVGRRGSHACLLFVLLQILFHCLVHDVFQRHVLLDGEEFHTGMNAFVDDEVAMNLTMYVSRHSWASIAKSQNIPLSVISEGMGHDSENTTQIYLASLDNSMIDKANELILRKL